MNMNELNSHNLIYITYICSNVYYTPIKIINEKKNNLRNIVYMINFNNKIIIIII